MFAYQISPKEPIFSSSEMQIDICDIRVFPASPFAFKPKNITGINATAWKHWSTHLDANLCKINNLQVYRKPIWRGGKLRWL